MADEIGKRVDLTNVIAGEIKETEEGGFYNGKGKRERSSD